MKKIYAILEPKMLSPLSQNSTNGLADNLVHSIVIFFENLYYPLISVYVPKLTHSLSLGTSECAN